MSFTATAALSTHFTPTARELVRKHLSNAPQEALALARIIDPRLAEELLPEFERQIQAKDPATAMSFAGAAARAPGDRAVRVVARCAEESEGLLQGVCFGLLWEMGSRGVPALRELARSERPAPRTQAVRILGDLDDPGLRGVFQQNLAWRDESARFEAAIALAKLGDPQGVPTLRQVLASSDETQRVQALVALTALGDSVQLGSLRDSLRGGQGNWRTKTLREMGRYKSPVIRDLLAAAAGDGSAAVRAAAAEGLAKHSGGLKEPLLSQLLADSDPDVRFVAAMGASSSTDRRAADELDRAARGTDVIRRLNALERIRPNAAQFLPTLRSALHDPNPMVRLAGLKGVVAAGSAADVALIQPLAEDEDGDIVLEAVNGIASLSPDEKFQRLVPLLESKNRRTAICAAAALVDQVAEGR